MEYIVLKMQFLAYFQYSETKDGLMVSAASHNSSDGFS
jgi:hypothetical protein